MNLSANDIALAVAGAVANNADLFAVIKDIIGVLAPLGIIIVAAIYLIGTLRSAKLNRDTGKETTDINEKDVNTKAAAQLTEMFTEGLNELRTELKEAKNQMKDLKLEVNELRADNQSLVAHIEALEKLVPNPPGSPIRPIMNKYK